MSGKQMVKPKTAGSLVISYVPLGEETSIELTVERTRDFLATPTKSGQLPSVQDIIKFMMLCKAKSLNPWVGDAYLVGYDSKDGPTFSLITSHQALLKRAEICPAYEGMESGVIVAGESGEPIERAGDYVHEGERLLGGWAKVYRSDRRVCSYDSLSFKTYNTNRSRWAKDPSGMIVKCAEASALRKAFPTQIGGLYTDNEMDHVANNQKNGKVVSAGSQQTSVLDHYSVGVDAAKGKSESAVSEPLHKAPPAVPDEPPTQASGHMEEIRAAIFTADSEELEGIYDFYVGANSPLKSQSDIEQVSAWCAERKTALSDKSDPLS